MMRRRGGFDRVSLLGSVVVHAGALVLIFWSNAHARPPLEFVTYQIELVSPPPAVQAPEPRQAQEELVIERPDPKPPEPEREKPKPVVEEKPKPKPPPKPEAKQPPKPQPDKEAEEKKPAAAVETPPEEKPKESGEGINVRMEGLRRDYPEYYQNIITQIFRCFRWTRAGSWQTTVYFVIKRDGTVEGLDFVKKSGNPDFDFEALGAVECAGDKGRFGALPEELPYDRLPIQFKFQPRSGGGDAPRSPNPNDETTANR